MTDKFVDRTDKLVKSESIDPGFIIRLMKTSDDKKYDYDAPFWISQSYKGTRLAVTEYDDLRSANTAYDIICQTMRDTLACIKDDFKLTPKMET